MKLSLSYIDGAADGDAMASGANLYTRQIDLIRRHWSAGLSGLAGGGEEKGEQDGECQAEGMPGTRAEEGKHDDQRSAAAPAVARRTVQLKIKMNASRSSTSLTVWAKRKTVQSRW